MENLIKYQLCCEGKSRIIKNDLNTYTFFLGVQSDSKIKWVYPVDNVR